MDSSYKARKGNRFGIDDHEAEVIGQEFERIAGETGEPPSAGSVVAAAGPEGSVLHEYFQWDDEAAADAFRLDQARRVIKTIVCVVRNAENEEVEVAAFVNIRPTATGEQGEEGSGNEQGQYVHVREVLSDEEKRAEAMGSLVRRLYCYRDEVSLYPELVFLVEALDRANEVVEEREFRGACLRRDEYTCQLCGKQPGKRSGELHVHHRLSRRAHPELREEISNGVTLCRSCHGRVGRGDRLDWNDGQAMLGVG